VHVSVRVHKQVCMFVSMFTVVIAKLPVRRSTLPSAGQPRFAVHSCVVTAAVIPRYAVVHVVLLQAVVTAAGITPTYAGSSAEL